MGTFLRGKATAVTGGVTGIGRAIALAFLRQGASVVVNHLGDDASDRAFDRLREEAPKAAPLVAAPGDIGNRETGTQIVEAAVKNFGGLDCFVANAGVSLFHDFLR